MRSLVWTVLLAGSVSSWACPRLSGRYFCRHPDGGIETFVISQRTSGSVTVFNMNGSEVLADGVPHRLPDDENVKNALFRSWCEETAELNGVLTGRYYSGGQPYGDLTLSVSYSRNNGKFRQVVSGVLKSLNDETPINNQLECDIQ